MSDITHEGLKAMSGNELARKCIGGLIAYAAQCARDVPDSSKVSEIRVLIEDIASYWGLDNFSDEALLKDFLQPFDLLTNIVKAGADLVNGLYWQRTAAVYGLYKYCEEMSITHGAEALGEICYIKDLALEIVAVWELDMLLPPEQE